MAIDAGSMLTRKLGPLPAWGWGVAVGGAYLAVKFLRGGTGGGGFAGGQDAQIVQVPTGIIPVSPNFTDELSEAVFNLNRRIDELQQDINNNIDNGEQMPGPTPTPPTTVPKDTTPKPTQPVKKQSISVAERRRILQQLGGPLAWADNTFVRANAYVRSSADAFRAWALRAAMRPTSGYKVVNGKIVKE